MRRCTIFSRRTYIGRYFCPDAQPTRGEVASYYLKTPGHMVPSGVEVWEYDMTAKQAKRMAFINSQPSKRMIEGLRVPVQAPYTPRFFYRGQSSRLSEQNGMRRGAY